MNLRYGDDKFELIKLSPLLIYDIATDIQVTHKWKQFAMLVGFNNEQIEMLQVNCGDRFPAENVIYHWFSKNPKVKDLADHLCTLLLEKPLDKLKKHLSQDTYNSLIEKLQRNRDSFHRPINSETSDGYLESNQNIKIIENNSSSDLHKQFAPSNHSTNSTSDPLTPEPGIVEVLLHDPSIPRSLRVQSNVLQEKEDNTSDGKSQANEDPTQILIETILKERSTEFYPEEFVEIDSVGRSLQGKFSSHFNLKLRSNNFYIRAFSLQKIVNSTKKKKKIYNIIWFLTHFRLNHFPTLTGFSFYDDYLFLLFPSQKCHTLYEILHRPHDTEYKMISAQNRLDILIDIGEGLAFIHDSMPFRGFHGQVCSHNVLITLHGAILTGFEKFCTQQPNYLKGLEVIKKPDIDYEEYFRKDKIQYLELICETWWNVQPSIPGGNQSESLLIKDIVRRNIVFPKEKYADWNENLNEHIRSLIDQHGVNTKQLGSVAEIVDELSGDIRDPIPSLDPPSYESCTEIYSELRRNDNENEDEDD